MIGLGFSVISRLSHCTFPEPASSAPAALPAMADATKAALVCKNVRRLSQAISCSFHERGRSSGELDLVLSCRQGEIRPVATRHHEATGDLLERFTQTGQSSKSGHCALPRSSPTALARTKRSAAVFAQIRCCCLAASV